MGTSVLDRVESSWASSRESHRIGLSDFTHGRKWRSELAECGTMEIIDRDRTCGWILSCECLDALMLRVAELEDELEQAQVAALIAERADKAVFRSGEELAEAATAIFDERHGEWLRELDVSPR